MLFNTACYMCGMIMLVEPTLKVTAAIWKQDAREVHGSPPTVQCMGQSSEMTEYSTVL